MESPVVDSSPIEEVHELLKNYYGKVLSKTEDLVTKSCCADDTKSRFADVYKLIPEEVKARNYGCGCTIPLDDLTGLKVLDLGSGAGLDAFILAKLVGENGRVYGLDMTDEQLAVARRNTEPVMEAFGFSTPNVEFHKGYIETADAIGDASIDLVVSDCVVNLSPWKDRVFKTIHRVLRPGGEFYISDIVSDRRVPEEISKNPVYVAECLGGALYQHDFFDIMQDAGFGDPRRVSTALVEEHLGGHPVSFYSVTMRGFRLATPFDRRCEDYGQVAWYRGNCEQQPAAFTLDDHHVFESGRPVPVCRNTARMLAETRLSKYFEVSAPKRHLGLFDCSAPSVDSDGAADCC